MAKGARGYPAPVKAHSKIRAATRNVSKPVVSSLARFTTSIPQIAGFQKGPFPTHY